MRFILLWLYLLAITVLFDIKIHLILNVFDLVIISAESWTQMKWKILHKNKGFLLKFEVDAYL